MPQDGPAAPPPCQPCWLSPSPASLGSPDQEVLIIPLVLLMETSGWPHGQGSENKPYKELTHAQLRPKPP